MFILATLRGGFFDFIGTTISLQQNVNLMTIHLVFPAPED